MNSSPTQPAPCTVPPCAVLNQCNYVVLDEADRMIDLGFEPQVHRGGCQGAQPGALPGSPRSAPPTHHSLPCPHPLTLAPSRS